MTKLSPSILGADPTRLGDAAALTAGCGCDELHFDVMDGHFVPNLTFGPHILKALKKQQPDLFFDVHLMLSRPMDHVDSFADAGADLITVHAEAENWLECVRHIRKLGMKAGVSLRPGTGVEAIQPHLNEVDRVLLMTVEPGFGGQKLMPHVLDKAVALRAMGFAGDIEADGGIKPDNMRQLTDAGVNVLVMGTAFFGSPAPAEVAQAVHAL